MTTVIIISLIIAAYFLGIVLGYFLHKVKAEATRKSEGEYYEN